MPIMNTLKSLDLPVIGKSLYRTEDQFMPSDFAMEQGAVKTDATIPQEIIIACKGKRRRVTGYLAEGVKLTGTSEWEDIVGTAGISTLNDGMSTVNNLGQLGFADIKQNGGNSTAGSVIQQPWLDRKFWKHSKPFDLNFNFNFVSENSSKNDVFLPAIALLSFCYPRLVDNVELLEKTKEKIGEFAGDGTNTKGETNVLNAVKNSLKAFAIPGPSLMYGAKKDSNGNATQGDNGDAVTIVVGNMFAFGACYLKQVIVEFSPNIDYSGYPVWCKCSISAEAMDSNYCEPNGDFNVSQWGNSANDISDLMKSLNTTVEDVAKNVMNIARATMNSITAYPQIFK